MIRTVEYDPGWPRAFERARAELRAAAGDTFVHVEHVGSTAVPGLAAKPVIDVMAAVHALADVQPHLPALARLGYEHRHTGMPDRLFLCRSRGGTRTHHLHVVPLSTWDTRNERLFRDFLRAHSDVAARYAALKRDAAARHGTAAGYTREKTAFVQAVVDAARDRAGLPRVPVWEE